MLVYLGLPSRNDIDVSSNKVQMNRIKMKCFKCKSLDSIIINNDKVQELEKNTSSLISNLYHNFESYFPERYLKSSIPKFTEDFEICAMKITSPVSKEEKYNSIEEVVNSLIEDFNEMETKYTEEIKKYSILTKRFEKVEKQLSGNLLEISLNMIAENPEELEFLKVFFVVVSSCMNDSFRDVVSRNDKISHSTVEKIATDHDYHVFKFYGLKSADSEIKKLMSQNNFFLKEFIDEDELNACIVEKNDFKDAKKFAEEFIESSIVKSLNFYALLRLVKLYLNCLLIYGLPPNYDIFYIRGKRSRDVLKYIGTLAESYGLFCNGSSSWLDISEENLFNSADLATSDVKLKLLEK